MSDIGPTDIHIQGACSTKDKAKQQAETRQIPNDETGQTWNGWHSSVRYKPTVGLGYPRLC